VPIPREVFTGSGKQLFDFLAGEGQAWGAAVGSTGGLQHWGAGPSEL
jgi:hypothetical protein